MSNTLTASDLNKADLKCKSIGQLTVNGSVISINNLQVQNAGNVASTATKVGYYLSVNTIISENDYFIGFDDQIALNPNASSNHFFNANVNDFTSIPAGTYYVGVIIDYDGNVAEDDEENNSCYYSYPQVVVDGNNAEPDLTCDDRGTLNITGTTVTVNGVKIKNIGAGQAGQSYVGYYLSTDQNFTTGDIKIGSKLISTLQQWTGVTVNFNVDISHLNIPDGTYYVGVIVDYDERVDESNESNNNDCFFYSPTLTINNGTGGGHKPDLRCADTGYLYTTSNSFSITNLRIENIGSATAGQSTVGYYLSTDTNISTSDYLVGTDHVTSLGTGAGSNSSTESITINYSDLSALPPGSYYVGILIDKANAVQESNESNNTCFFNSPKIVIDNPYDNPDLTCGTQGYLTINNSTLSLSGFKVRNNGNAAASASRVGYYLSQDSNISTTDIFLGDDYVEGLAAGALSAGEDFAYNLNSLNLSSGTYFFGMIVDYDDDLTEVDENNNTCFFTSPKIVIEQAPSDPDLTCISRGNLWVENNSVTIYDLTIKNQGEGTAGASKVGVYLSTNTTFSKTEDTFIGSIDINTLSPHSTQTVSFGANYSNLNLPNGTYYVGIIVDHNDDVTESNEYNNNSCFWTNPTVVINNTNTTYKPDLTCEESASIHVNGTQIDINNLRIKNIGNVTSNNPTKIKYYLSTNTSFSTTDYLIGEDHIPVLLGGQSSTEALSVNVGNSNIPSGTYYIGLVIDPDHIVEESNENNNTCYFSNTQITINNTPQYPDLTCDSPGYLAVTGTNVSIQNLRVKNIGTVTAGASYVGFYLSTDQTITTSDYKIGSRYINSLNSWQSTTFDFNVDASTITGIPSGTYYVGVIVDHTHVVSEVNEGNNVCSYNNPTVVIGGGSGYNGDLTCDSNGTLTINGSYINITGHRVKNIGTQRTNRFTYVGYFLSLDQNFDASSDILIGTDYISSLNSWQSVTHNFSKDLAGENLSPGNYYIGMIIDYQGVIFESNENNNTCYFNNQTITVGGTGGGYQPDLTCSYAGNLTVTNNNISVSGTTIKNIGTITANSSKVGFYLSTDQNFTTNDHLIGTATTGSLASWSSVVVNFSKSISGLTVPNGNYYLGIIIDYEDAVNESDESNNNDCSFNDIITIGGNGGGGNGDLPNLVCEYPGALTINGSKISIQNLRVKNTGNGIAGESRVGFYLSSDATITTSDFRFTSTYVGSLNPWEFSRETIINVDVADLGLPAGEYFIGAFVDYQFAVSETNEGDNTCYFTNQKVTIGGTNNGQADLVCNSSGTLSTNGSFITVNNFIVKNEGSGTASPSLLGYYLSTDTGITTNDLLLGTDNIPELLSGGTHTASEVFDISNLGLQDGTYYVGMIIDKSNVVNESSEANNNDCAFTNQPIVINNNGTGGGGGNNDLADLKCENVGTYTISGNTIIINGTKVKNIGTRTAPLHLIGYYLSPDPIINPNAANSNDISIKFINGNQLSSWGSQTYNTSIDLTGSNVPSGTYYIGIFIDSNDSISENDESNNSCSFTNTITINNTGGGGGNRCTDFKTIACGEALPYQSTTSSTNDFDIWDYSGCLSTSGNEYNAGDELYKIVNVPANTTLTIDLKNMSTDLDILVFNSCSTNNNCIAKGVSTSTSSEQVVINNASGTYFVVVDGKTPYREGSFTIEVSCNTNGGGGNNNRCADFTQINCGNSITGTTSTGTNNFSIADYNCHSSINNFAGKDKVYKINVPTVSTLNVSLSNLSADLDVFVLTSCSNTGSTTNCVAAGVNSYNNAEQITIPNAQGDYFIVVDAAQTNTTSSFNLSVTCTTNGGGTGHSACACSGNDFQQNSFCDDMDSYSVGALGPQSACWTTNGGSEGSSVDGRIVFAQTDNCLQIDGSMNRNQNAILKLGNRATGVHETSFKIQVPTGSRSLVYLVQETGSGGNKFGGRIIFVGDGTGLLNVNGQYYEFTHPDSWFDMTLVASLENNLMYFIINGSRKFVWQLSYTSLDRGGLEQLGGYMFTVENASSKLMIDDVEFSPLSGPNNSLSDVTTGHIDNMTPVPYIEQSQVAAAPQLDAFPNPTRGQFTTEVSLEEATDFRLDVLNITGDIIQTFTAKDAKFMEYQLDLEKESNGVYYLRLQTDKEVVTKQVVLLK